MAQWRKPGSREAVRTAVRFPLRLPVHLKTEDGMVEATTRDISSNGLLFESAYLPRIGSSIEFTMDLPAEVLGSKHQVSVCCTGRVVRHDLSGQTAMTAAVIDQYTLRA